MTIDLDLTPFGLPLLTWTSLAMIAGVLIGGALFARRAPDLDTDRRTLWGVTVAGVLWGLAGARLLHVADYADYYAAAPFQALYLWNGGMSLWGGVLAGLGGALWSVRRLGLSVARAGALAAAPGLVGLAAGRAGDLLAGERAATGTSLPWGVVYANPGAQAHAEGAAVHPVAAYELLLDAALAGAVALWGRRLPEGAVLPAALAVWGAGRFVIALARTDPTLLGLQQAQWLALIVAGAVAVGALRAQRRRRG